MRKGTSEREVYILSHFFFSGHFSNLDVKKRLRITTEGYTYMVEKVNELPGNLIELKRVRF